MVFSRRSRRIKTRTIFAFVYWVFSGNFWGQLTAALCVLLWASGLFGSGTRTDVARIVSGHGVNWSPMWIVLPPMHGDEGEMGTLALLALHGPNSGISPHPLPLFSTAFLEHPTLFYYVQAGAL